MNTEKNQVEKTIKKDTTNKQKADQLSELGFLPKEKVDESVPTEHNAINRLKDVEGKVGWAILWLMGVPLPILFIFFLLRGCT